MVEQEGVSYLLSEFSTKLRDLEERSKILKERVILIGQNLLDTKDETEKEIITLKRDNEEIKSDIKNIKNRLILLSQETANFARKEELAIIFRQLKMLEPFKNLNNPIKKINHKV